MLSLETAKNKEEKIYKNEIKNEINIELENELIKLENNTNLINDMKQKIYILEKEINLSQKKIFTLCPHNWVYDTNSGPYDRTTYICEKCSLYKNRYLYN